MPLLNASSASFPPPSHGSGSGWFATPFLYDSFIHYFTPVYPDANQPCRLLQCHPAYIDLSESAQKSEPRGGGTRTIQTLGYSELEAHFLRLVALHSGYFVRRQFVRSVGAERGQRAQDFIEELVGRGRSS